MTRPSLAVVDAECAHGGRLRHVDVLRAATGWSVVATYDCAEQCTQREASEEHPASVIDTDGTERWPSLN